MPILPAVSGCTLTAHCVQTRCLQLQAILVRSGRLRDYWSLRVQTSKMRRTSANAQAWPPRSPHLQHTHSYLSRTWRRCAHCAGGCACKLMIVHTAYQLPDSLMSHWSQSCVATNARLISRAKAYQTCPLMLGRHSDQGHHAGITHLDTSDLCRRVMVCWHGSTSLIVRCHGARLLPSLTRTRKAKSGKQRALLI